MEWEVTEKTGKGRFTAQTDYIFVYGTLMKGLANHDTYLAERVGGPLPGEMKGELYHLKYGYPAAIDGPGRVKGEIYLLEDANELLPQLDYLEDFNQPGSEDLYKREIREVRDEHGNIIFCYVYLWSNNRIKELKENSVYINNGDWKKFISENNCLAEDYCGGKR